MASVLKRNKSFHIMVSLGYDLQGKQIRKTMNWRPPDNMSPSKVKKELEKKKVEFEQAVLYGRILDGNINFKDFSERWLRDYGETQLAPKTYDRYTRMLDDRIIPSIGHIKLKNIKPHHLMELYKKLAEPGEKRIRNCKLSDTVIDVFNESGFTKVKLAKKAKCAQTTIYQALKQQKISSANAEKILKCLKLKEEDNVIAEEGDMKLANKTVRHYHRLISVILKTAVYWQVIHSSPAERVKPPKAENKEAKYLDEKQTAELIKKLENESIDKRAMILTFIYSGMRRGELLALKWDDFDFENKVVTINKSLQYLAGRGIYIKEPKTRASVRTIMLSDEVFEVLGEYKAWQEKQKEEIGDLWMESDFVFCNCYGGHIHPDTVTAWFTDFTKKQNLDNITIHSLRHTNLTLLLAAGVPLRTVASRGGHAQSSTTSNIYAHALQSVDELAAGKLGEMLRV